MSDSLFGYEAVKAYVKESNERASLGTTPEQEAAAFGLDFEEVLRGMVTDGLTVQQAAAMIGGIVIGLALASEVS